MGQRAHSEADVPMSRLVNHRKACRRPPRSTTTCVACGAGRSVRVLRTLVTSVSNQLLPADADVWPTFGDEL